MTTLHLMVGLPCSGKTTRAKTLETDLGALRLTPDEWHRFLFGQDATHPEHDARHDKIETLQWQMAEASLRHGIDVILDFGFWTKAERENFRQRAAALGANTEVHVQDVPFQELLERCAKRNDHASDDVTFIPLAMMHDYARRFEKPDAEEMTILRDV